MEILTDKLILKPLSEQEMRMYILNDFSLETYLDLEHWPRKVDERIRRTIQKKILPNLIDKSKEDIFFTFWTIIDMKKNIMVGDLCFKGEPNEKGEVEIGYGTFVDFQGKGYMTEAVGALAKWTFKQNKISAILAETDPKNIASQKVLEKNKFVVERETKDYFYWRLDKFQLNKVN